MKFCFECFQITLSFFTTIPVVKHYEWTKEKIRYMPVLLPLLGAIIGIILYGVMHLVTLLNLANFTISFIGPLTLLIITGGLHHDALMDTADAHFSRSQTISRRLEIMKDSRVGAFAVVTMISYIGLLWITFYEIVGLVDYLWFLFVPLFSRTVMPMMIYNFNFAKKDGFSNMYSEAIVKKDRYILYVVFLIISTGAIGALGIYAICFPIISIIGYFCYKRFIYKQFGGLTGDLLGAYVLILELILFMALIPIGRMV